MAKEQAVHSLIDVSDGIASDLRHLLAPARQGARIDLDRLPRSPFLQEVATQYDWDSNALATTAGEDYCLLCTIDASAYPRLSERYARAFGNPLTAIGTILEETSGIQYFQHGVAVALATHGFDHFAQEETSEP